MSSHSSDTGVDSSVGHRANSNRGDREQSTPSRHDVSQLVSSMDLNHSSGSQKPKDSTKHKNHRQRGRTNIQDRSTHERHSGDKRPSQNSASAKRSQPKQHKMRAFEPLKPLSSSEHTNVVCRFVVRSDAGLSASSINVEKPFNTKQLWRVFAPVQDCPICLERPEVPRMLNCGHLMCYHCMIKHKKYSDTPGECPICGVVVAMTPSRATPVSFLENDPLLLPKENDEVVLTLMRRPVNSTLALPVNLDLHQLQKKDDLPDPSFILWSRVCQGSVEYAKQELAAEVKYLIGASRKSIEEFGADDEGYDEAVTDLKRYIHSLNVTPNPPEPQTSSHKRSKISADGTSKDIESIYFYQTSFESPMVYTLNSLDVSILKAAYGSYEKFPTSLIAKALNIDFTILDKTNDKRYKTLFHLPEQTPIALMDCDWEGIIDPAVLKKFSAKLKEREAKKQQSMVKDVVERQKAQEAIDQQFKVEIAEAMLPHEIPANKFISTPIDTTHLPRLKKSSASEESEARAREAAQKALAVSRKEYDELMKRAYVPKKGRKDMVLEF